MLCGVIYFTGMVLGPRRGNTTANPYNTILTTPFNPMIKHFYADDSIFSPRMTISTSTGHGLFDEHKNYVNHMIWSLQSLDFTQLKTFCTKIR